MHGALKCYGYPNQNWVHHFENEKDSLSFLLNVVTTGYYELEIEYALQTAHPTCRIHATHYATNISSVLPQFISEQLPSPDRVKRGEAYEMTWGKQKIGVINMQKGLQPITIHATNGLNTNNLKIKTLIINNLEVKACN